MRWGFGARGCRDGMGATFSSFFAGFTYSFLRVGLCGRGATIQLGDYFTLAIGYFSL